MKYRVIFLEDEPTGFYPGGDYVFNSIDQAKDFITAYANHWNYYPAVSFEQVKEEAT